MKKIALAYVFSTLLVSSIVTGGLIKRGSQAQSSKPANNPQYPSTQSMPRQGMKMAQIDQHFIEMMIPHHEGAVKMADLALVQSKRPEIKKLAVSITSSQSREIQNMRTWYKQWYGKEVPAQPMNMGMMGGSMHQKMMGHQPGMGQNPSGMMASDPKQRQMQPMMHHDMMGAEMNLDALKNATDFDREFIRQMIPHHQMAIMMARMVLRSSTHSEVQTLAQAIIESQSSEIQQMRQWYQTWYNPSGR
jgi:uncharacterized protein (DUF305 family)